MASTTGVAGNVIICYFHRDSSGLVAAYRDKKQTSFLIQFLQTLSPVDLDCKPNWLEVTCSRYITESEIVEMNEKLQQSINHRPQHQPLRNCQIMLKITFELSRLLEGVEYIHHKFETCTISRDQIQSYLDDISQQIRAISPHHIQNDLFIMHPAPKRVMKQNKRRISIVSPRSVPNYGMLTASDLSAVDDDQSVHSKEESKSPDVVSNDGGGSSSNSEDEAVQNILKQPRFRVKTLREVQFEDLSLKKECKSRFYSFSEPQTKYIPIPLDDQYPDELYDDGWSSWNEQNANLNLFGFGAFPMDSVPSSSSSSSAQYPEDKGANLQDFIGRKFHLNANVVKQWINDRVQLMHRMGSSSSSDDIDDDPHSHSHCDEVKYRKFAVIDVRCHDFVGGNIPYCYNVDFEVFESMLNDLLIQFQYESDMVLHCMYSQHRGPRGAFWYWQHRRKWEARYPQKLKKQRVWVLDGGFKGWISEHVLDSDLVANVESKYWDEEYFPLTGREFFYNNDWRVPDSDDE